jgi:hypothetical protein
LPTFIDRNAAFGGRVAFAFFEVEDYSYRVLVVAIHLESVRKVYEQFAVGWAHRLSIRNVRMTRAIAVLLKLLGFGY